METKYKKSKKNSPFDNPLLEKRKKPKELKDKIDDEIQEIEEETFYGKKIKPTVGIEIELLIHHHDLFIKQQNKNCPYGEVVAETGNYENDKSNFNKPGFSISPDGFGYGKETDQVIEIATEPVDIDFTNRLVLQTNKFISPFVKTIKKEFNKNKNSESTIIDLSSIIDQYNKNQNNPELELFMVKHDDYKIELKSKELPQKELQAFGSIQFNFAMPPSFLGSESIKCFTQNLPKQPDKLQIQNNSHPEDTFIDDFGKKNIIKINQLTLEKAKTFSDQITKKINGNIIDIENIKSFLTTIYYHSTIAHSTKLIDQIIGIEEHSPGFAMKEYFKINPKIDLKQFFNLVKNHELLSEKNLKSILESMAKDINKSVTEIANTYNIQYNPFNNNTNIEFYYDNQSAKNIKFAELNQELRKNNKEWLSTSSKPIKQDNGLIHTVFETRFTHLCELNNLPEEIESCYTGPLTKFYTENQKILNSKLIDKKSKPNTTTNFKEASKVLSKDTQQSLFN